MLSKTSAAFFLIIVISSSMKAGTTEASPSVPQNPTPANVSRPGPNHDEPFTDTYSYTYTPEGVKIFSLTNTKGSNEETEKGSS